MPHRHQNTIAGVFEMVCKLFVRWCFSFFHQSLCQSDSKYKSLKGNINPPSSSFYITQNNSLISGNVTALKSDIRKLLGPHARNPGTFLYKWGKLCLQRKKLIDFKPWPFHIQKKYSHHTSSFKTITMTKPTIIISQENSTIQFLQTVCISGFSLSLNTGNAARIFYF